MSHNVLSETKTKTKIKLSSLEFQAQNEKKKIIYDFSNNRSVKFDETISKINNCAKCNANPKRYNNSKKKQPKLLVYCVCMPADLMLRLKLIENQARTATKMFSSAATVCENA